MRFDHVLVLMRLIECIQKRRSTFIGDWPERGDHRHRAFILRDIGQTFDLENQPCSRGRTLKAGPVPRRSSFRGFVRASATSSSILAKVAGV